MTVLFKYKSGRETLLHAEAVDHEGCAITLKQRDGSLQIIEPKMSDRCQIFVMNESGATVARYNF